MDPKSLLLEAKAVLPRVVWDTLDPVRDGEERDQRSCLGEVDGWQFLVCDFDIGHKGFSRGSRGYQATIIHGMDVIDLPPELAWKAFLAMLVAKGSVVELRFSGVNVFQSGHCPVSTSGW